MSGHWQTQKTTRLFKAILKLNNVKEYEKFFRDICTLSEIREMANMILKEFMKIAPLIFEGAGELEV